MSSFFICFFFFFLLLLSLHVSRFSLEAQTSPSFARFLRSCCTPAAAAVFLSLLLCFLFFPWLTPFLFCCFSPSPSPSLSWFFLFLFFGAGREGGDGTSENGLICVVMMMSSCRLVVFFVVVGIGAAAAAAAGWKNRGDLLFGAWCVCVS
jgi:hypothetical protein